VLRRFCSCSNWPWNVVENKSKCYCALLPVTLSPCLLLCSSACYCTPLPVTVFHCLLLYSTACYCISAISISACLYLRNINSFRASCFFATFRHRDCNRLWLSRFVQFAINNDLCQKINEQNKLTKSDIMTSSQLRYAHCCTCSNVLQYSALNCKYVTEGSLCLCSYSKVVFWVRVNIEVQFYTFFYFGARYSGYLTPRPARFTCA
jgi:hypothetical protein